MDDIIGHGTGMTSLGQGVWVKRAGVQGTKHLMEEVRLWVYSCVVVPCIPHLLDSLLLTNIWYSISPLNLFHPRSDLGLCCDALITARRSILRHLTACPGMVGIHPVSKQVEGTAISTVTVLLLLSIPSIPKQGLWQSQSVTVLLVIVNNDEHVVPWRWGP